MSLYGTIPFPVSTAIAFSSPPCKMKRYSPSNQLIQHAARLRLPGHDSDAVPISCSGVLRVYIGCLEVVRGG